MLLCSSVALPAAGAQPATTVAPPSEPGDGPNPGRWTGLETGTNAKLNGVSFSSPLAGHVVGAGGAILATADGGETWRPQAACTRTAPCEQSSTDRITADLAGVGFWDPARGVAVGTGGTVVSTADGGKTWTARLACERSRPCRAGSPDRATADLTAVSVAAPSHAYAVGKAGTMLVSDDHGRSWRRLTSCGTDTPVGSACADAPSPGQPADLTAVSASSTLVAHAVGAGGALFATENGAEAFRPIPICVQDPSLLEAALREGQERTRRFLEGKPAPPPPAAQDPDVVACAQAGGTRRIRPQFAGVAFTDPRRPDHLPRTYAVGAEGTIMISSGTASWLTEYACAASAPCTESSPDRLRPDLHAVVFPHDLLGYAVGAGGTILSRKRASDLAQSPAAGDPPSTFPKWVPEESGTDRNLNAVSFPAPDVGYAVGEQGTVLKLAAPAPGAEVNQLRPARGPTIGRTQMTITGKGLARSTDVYFGPTRAPSFTVESDTSITVTVPPRPAGTVYVSVATPDGPSPSPRARFTYEAASGGAWEPAPRCSSGCQGPAVVLPGGKVVVAGSATEVYDPATRRWSGGAALGQPRTDHTLTALSDGRALAAGGGQFSFVAPGAEFPQDLPHRGAEVYDSVAGTWSSAGDMTQARFGHTATPLSDGRVLVAGGRGPGHPSGSPTAEIWDPRSATWSPIPGMAVERSGHTATRLPDGKVIVVGGCGRACPPEDSTEIYDSASGTWRRVAAPKVPRTRHTATVMPDGEVLVVGGTDESGETVPLVERYSRTTKTWTLRAPMRVPRARHSATALGDGRLLVTGGVTASARQGGGVDAGEPLAFAEVFDPGLNRWSLLADMPVPRAGHTAVLLEKGCGGDCGKVLVLGGERCSACGTDRFEPPSLFELAAERAPGRSSESGWPLLAIGAVLVTVVAGIVFRRRHSASGGSAQQR